MCVCVCYFTWRIGLWRRTLLCVSDLPECFWGILPLPRHLLIFGVCTSTSAQKKQSSSDSYLENGFRTGLKVRSWLRPHPSDARLGLHLGLIGTNSLEELCIGWLSWRILSYARMKQSQSSVRTIVRLQSVITVITWYLPSSLRQSGIFRAGVVPVTQARAARVQVWHDPLLGGHGEVREL